MIIDIELVQVAGTALAIKAGSLLMDHFWGKIKKPFEEKANTLDEMVEVKLGMVFPLEVHQAYDSLVKRVVSAIDWLTNPVIFRRIERAILAIVNGADREKLLAEFYAVAKEKAGAVISEELKKLINEEKLPAAVESIKASATISLPAEFVATRNITEDVNKAVVAVKTEAAPISTEDINKKIANTRAQLDAFIKKA